jgi:hypothetical protein
VATLAIKGFTDLIKGKKDKTSAPSSPAASRPASRTTSAKVCARFTPLHVVSCRRMQAGIGRSQCSAC